MPDATPFPSSPAQPAFRRRLARRAAWGAVMATLLVAGAAHAQSANTRKEDAKKEDATCAQYGAGFQRVPGTNSCVRTGASVRADAYGGTSLTGAPNQFGGTPSGSGTAAASSGAADPWKSAR